MRNAAHQTKGRTSAGFAGLFWGALALLALSGACQTTGPNTIAELRRARVEIKEEKVEDVPEKAMESYRRFLEETPDSSLKAEAIRRLADLKVEKEYGQLSGAAAAREKAPAKPSPAPAAAGTDKISPAQERAASPSKASPASTGATSTDKTSPAAERAASSDKTAAAPARSTASVAPGGAGESRRDAGKRPAKTQQAAAPAANGTTEGADDLRKTGPLEAVELYQKLLKKYPAYERNDEVLYQLSRAYEELGRVDEAVEVMGRLAREHPGSPYIDEVQFRRGEYFFPRRRYPEAQEAYGSIVAMGASSSYYQLALYKLGWTLYKQDLYEKAVDRFIALLDYKVSTGYDFAQTADPAERKRMDDTFRVVSLSFSNLGGANTAVGYFARHGRRTYEDAVYGNLAEFYFDKQRYSDAAAAYSAFVDRDPYHKASPRFQARVIEIQLAGGFPSLAIDAKKRFVGLYGFGNAEYWRDVDRRSRRDVLAGLKANLLDLAKHYHALYQSPKQVKDKDKNFEEALRWYREYIASFSADADTPPVNYLLADLYLENKSFDLAAEEYEKTSYHYSSHEQSAKAGYAAIYAWRQHLAAAAPAAKDQVTREIARSSLQFAISYPGHEKAAIVLGAAVDDLYAIHDYAPAAAASRKLVELFPRAEAELVRRAWLVNGHANYEMQRYADAETAYVKLLGLLPPRDTTREGLTDYLASAIYKQGEQANAERNFPAAAAHFLRVGKAAPNSKIRVNAEYDAAAALMEAKDWAAAATVLERFRTLFPGHALQPEVTGKLAYVYRESGKIDKAANEYERMEQEATGDDARREALLTAAELHEKAGNQDRALTAYRRYADRYPHPAEPNLEARSKVADALKKKNDRDGYLAELALIVAGDAAAGGERTPRTRFLAAQAALVLAQRSFDRFAEVRLTEPFKANLSRKEELMKAATQQFNKLVDYELGDVTAAATYYLAEIYANFSRDLKESERPKDLSALEREEYELAIEEQAYPFEEKAIATHQSNLELISRGVYNEWIDRSLQKLAALVPARFDKPEEESPVVTTVDRYVFSIGQPAAPAEQPKQDAKPGAAKQAVQSTDPAQKTDGMRVSGSDGDAADRRR